MVGSRMIFECRHGATCISAKFATEKFVDGALTAPTDTATTATPDTHENVFNKFDGGKSKFERESIMKLQKADPEYKDIITALEAMKALGQDSDKTAVYNETKKRLAADPGPSKRAEGAIQQMEHYKLDELLDRVVLDPSTNAAASRVVVPSGGLRVLYYNGRRYRLPLRKSILLLYHDGESIVGHPGVKDTVRKICQTFRGPA